MSISSSILAALGCLLVALFMWFRKAKASASLPPGPKPVPLFGNIRELTTKELWLPAHQWAKQYGTQPIAEMQGVSTRIQAILYIYIFSDKALYF